MSVCLGSDTYDNLIAEERRKFVSSFRILERLKNVENLKKLNRYIRKHSNDSSWDLVEMFVLINKLHFLSGFQLSSSSLITKSCGECTESWNNFQFFPPFIYIKQTTHSYRFILISATTLRLSRQKIFF